MQWREGAGYYFYPKSASNARVAGACAAHLALLMTDPDLVHCTGHSLGGQVCGYMGHFAEGTLGRVTGTSNSKFCMHSLMMLSLLYALFDDALFGHVKSPAPFI